jgi:hypothetical protein
MRVLSRQNWAVHSNIPKTGDHTPNTAIVTYKTPDGRTLFVDFMGMLIGLTNEEIRRTVPYFNFPLL